MSMFKMGEHMEKNETEHQTESPQPGDFWLLLFVSTAMLLLVFKFYS